MMTYDAVLVAVLVVWWVTVRKKYDWRAILFYYLMGVMFADVLSAVILAVAYDRHPDVIRVGAFLMPIGGLVVLAYSVFSGKLSRTSERFRATKIFGDGSGSKN